MMSEQDNDLMNEPAAGETPDADAPETSEATGASAGAGADEGAQPGAVAFPYSATGAAFTAWFNDRVRRLPNPFIRLGARSATVKELHADGRLECSLHASAGEAEEIFVAFEPSHLDQLLLKFAAQGN